MKMSAVRFLHHCKRHNYCKIRQSVNQEAWSDADQGDHDTRNRRPYSPLRRIEQKRIKREAFPTSSSGTISATTPAVPVGPGRSQIRSEEIGHLSFPKW